MQHFYDKQIRRYVTQIVRLMSTFGYKDGKGNLVNVPVMYGDLTRQVGSIIRDNSENKIPSAPRMAVYITGLEMDRTRTADSSYVNKLNIRERAFDTNGDEYLKKEGKNYTVERLMPTPYNLTVSVDIWTSNTDQKLQIMEQILMLFNPSLEIQTTDNYVDWTSLSVVNLEGVTWSSRSIPTGTESEIDVATLQLSSPVYISAPAKVKKLGVITNIITAIFADNGIEINTDDTAYAQSLVTEPVVFDDPFDFEDSSQTLADTRTEMNTGKREALAGETTLVTTSHNNYDLLFLNGVAKLIGKNAVVGADEWTGYISALPKTGNIYENGVTEIHLKKSSGLSIVGQVTINPADETELIVNLDSDTLPNNSVITSSVQSSGNVDLIIDPTRFNPKDVKTVGTRLLLLGSIGHVQRSIVESENSIMLLDTGVPFSEVVDAKIYVNGSLVSTTTADGDSTRADTTDSTYDTFVIKFNDYVSGKIEYELYLDVDGPDAWKNSDGSDFAASTNDIIEWDGNNWTRIWKASDNISNNDPIYVTNLRTGQQYKFYNGQWVLSYEGEYPDGTWKIVF